MADVRHNFSQAGLLKRNVLIQKDDYGFGLTVSGDNPVYVQSVKPGSAASKAGVEVGDKIIKVNGTLVTESNHIEVVTLIKSGSYVALTLLGKDNKQQGHTRTRSLTGIIPSISSLQAQPQPQTQPYNTSPSDVNKSDRIKDVERTLNQERDFNKGILEKYRRAPSPKTQVKLAESKTRISALEKQLQFLSGTLPDKSAAPYRPLLQPVEPRDRPPSHTSSIDPSSLTSRSPASYSHSSIPLSSHVERTESSDEPTQHSNLGSSSTPNLGMMNSSGLKRARLESDIFEGHASIVEEPDHSMDSMKIMFDAKRMENTFGYKKTGSNEDVQIYSMEDGEFSDEEPLDEHGPFESIDLLKDKKAHLAIFLHYLISNSDPTPLFFWVVTEIYSNEQRSNNVQEWKKWGYEIYSTFVAQSAPLKVNVGGDMEEKIIEEALNDPNTTEHRLRNIFSVARSRLKPDLEEMLSDFRQKRLIGLGGLFGDRQLEDDMDRAAELKTVETTLMPHLDTLLGDHESSTDIQSDKNFAMACAIATLMKSAGLSGKVSSGKGTSLERCRSFAEKEKSSFMNINKYKKNKIHHMGHQFQSFQYSSITLCNVCNGLLWGIGIQGLQCQSCEFNVHRKNCMEGIKENCTVKKLTRRPRPDKRQTQTIDGIPNLKQEDQATHSLDTKPTRGHSMSETDGRTGTDVDEPTQGDSESDRVPTPSNPPIEGATPATPQITPKSKTLEDKRKGVGKVGKVPTSKNIHRSNSEKSMGNRKGQRHPNTENGHQSPYPRVDSPQPDPQSDIDTDFSDSDFEHAVPPWSASVDKKIIKKLKSKEIKRQEVIHELLHTEKTHVRNLKILDKIFYRNIKKSNTLLPEEITKIFPNLDDLIKIHESLLDQMKEREAENEVIENIGDIMLNAFGGENMEHVKGTCATFCRQQKSALSEWRVYRENRKEFATIMARLESNHHCRRLQFAAILASTHQRLVKYPLLLESLNKTTSYTHSDYKNVEKATECCKYILNYVNDEIKRCEDELRLVELSKKIIDKTTIPDENTNEGNTEEKMENEGPVGKFNILQHKLVLEGDLVWKINLNKKLDLHVVLLNDTLVLLTKQDEKFTLKMHSTLGDNKGHSPLIPMRTALIREVATDRKAFFLVSTSTKQPHIYELVAQTHLEKKLWVDNINQAIEVNKVDEISLQGRRHGIHSSSATTSPTTTPTPTTPTPTTPTELEEDDGEEGKVRGNSEVSEGPLSDDEEKPDEKEIDSGNSDESDEEEKSSTAHVLSKEKLEELNDQLSENETDLKRLITKRSTILSELHGDKYNPYNIESMNTGPTKLVISAIEQVDQLHEIFGQFSPTVSDDQRDSVAQSITGLQRYLKDILNIVCTTNRHDSCTDSYDGEKDVDRRDSKRTSSKTYSSDMTDSLPRHSPLGDAILSTSPPPILISRTLSSQEQETCQEDSIPNHEDLSTAVMSGADDVSSSLKMAEPISPCNDSLPKHESGVLITSPFKIQKLRKRPSDPAKLTSKVPSFTEQHHSDSSDSDE